MTHRNGAVWVAATGALGLVLVAGNVAQLWILAHAVSAVQPPIAVVPQQPIIVRGTVRDNLLIAAPHANEEAIESALKRSALLDWVQQLPDGLDTELGVSGAAMSGGQRRRLTIARAILMGVRNLVFDEPTAHLDAMTASEIEATIRNLSGARIVFSHDLRVTSVADHLVVMEQGTVVTAGIPQEVFRRRPELEAVLQGSGEFTGLPSHQVEE